MNNQKKALLVALAVAGVSVSGPMVKWSLSCGASPVMIAFGRMALSFALLLMNLLVPYINDLTRQKPLGGAKAK